MQNPYALPGAGAVLALLAALGVLAARRRKTRADVVEEPAADAEPEPEPVVPVAAATAVAAAAEPESEAPAEAVAETPAAEEAPAAPAEVDALAEADMYISYGRDEQAEDILKLALQTEPGRQALHGKLLEIYARREDVTAFNEVAGDLHVLSKGDGEEWAKAAALGIVLDPANPLYGGKSAEPEAVPAEADDGLEFDLSDFKNAEIQPPADAAPAVDLGRDIDFDLDLDHGAKPADDEPVLPVASASAAMLLDDGEAAKPAMSLSDLDLDLPGAETAAAAPSASNLLEEDEESAFEAEMTTKLDLAAAYQEIGDKEGARELLEEVTRAGNAGQIARAQDMLSKLT